jgi:hypothetical protein
MASNKKKSNQLTVNDYIKLGGVALGSIATLFIGYKIYRFIQKKSLLKQETGAYNKELNKKNLSMGESDYVSIAKGIETALSNQWDDDEKRVYAELSKLQTADDWRKLNVVFGVRKRKSLPVWGAPTIEGGLKEWLTDALSESEQKKVSDILSRIGVVF